MPPSSSSTTGSSPAHGDARRPAKKRRADAAAPPPHARPPHARHAQLGLVQHHQHQQADLGGGWFPAPPFDLPIDAHHPTTRDTLDGLPALASPHPSPYTAVIPFPSSLVAPSPFEQPVHWPAPAQQAPAEWTPNTPQSDAERTPSLLGADVTTAPSQLAWSHSLPPSPGAVDPISAESSPYPWFPWMPTVPPPMAGSPDQYSASPFTPLGSIPTPPPFTAAVEPLPLAGFPLASGNPSFPLSAGPVGYGHGPSDVPAGYQMTRESKDLISFDRTMASEFHPPPAARFVADVVLDEHHARPPLARSRPSADATALPQVAGLELGRRYPVATEQLDEREWIKPEPSLDRAIWEAPQYAPVPGQLLLTTQPNLADNMPKVSRPSPETAALSHVSSLALRGPQQPGVAKPQLGEKEWIKPEPLDRAGWDGRGFAPVEVQAPPQPVAVEKASKAGAEPDGETARDRKKRIRFDDERLRRETSNTRSMGACLRCHNQRVRVSDAMQPPTLSPSAPPIIACG